MLRQERSDVMADFRAVQGRMETAYQKWRVEAEHLPSYSEYEKARDAYLEFLARARAEVPE